MSEQQEQQPPVAAVAVGGAEKEEEEEEEEEEEAENQRKLTLPVINNKAVGKVLPLSPKLGGGPVRLRDPATGLLKVASPKKLNRGQWPTGFLGDVKNVNDASIHIADSHRAHGKSDGKGGSKKKIRDGEDTMKIAMTARPNYSTPGGRGGPGVPAQFSLRGGRLVNLEHREQRDQRATVVINTGPSTIVRTPQRTTLAQHSDQQQVVAEGGGPARSVEEGTPLGSSNDNQHNHHNSVGRASSSGRGGDEFAIPENVTGAHEDQFGSEDYDEGEEEEEYCDESNNTTGEDRLIVIQEPSTPETSNDEENPERGGTEPRRWKQNLSAENFIFSSSTSGQPSWSGRHCVVRQPQTTTSSDEGGSRSSSRMAVQQLAQKEHRQQGVARSSAQVVPAIELKDIAATGAVPLGEFVAMVREGGDRVPLISSWPAGNPIRAGLGTAPAAGLPAPPGTSSTTRGSGYPSKPTTSLGGRTPVNALSASHGKPKTEFVVEVEAFLARECSRFRPLNARIANCCVALDEMGSAATTFIPLFEQIKKLVVDFGSQLGEVEASRDDAIAAAVDVNNKEKDSFYQQCLLKVLGEKKRQTAKLKEAELAVADIQADREYQLAEAKKEVWDAVKKVHEDKATEEAMRQLVTSVYRTNEELREEISMLQHTIRSNGGEVPSLAKSPTGGDSPRGTTLGGMLHPSAPGVSASGRPGALAASGVSDHSIPVRSLGNTVPIEFINASRVEMNRARLSTQRALIDAASETKSSYRSLLDLSRCENEELTEKVRMLEEQGIAMEKHIHNQRFNYEQNAKMLPESEQEEALQRAQTPRPSLPFEIQQKLGINLMLSSKNIAEELSTVALRLYAENRTVVARNRRLAISTAWMEERIINDNAEESGGYVSFIATEKDEEWPTLHHFLRTNVSPSVPNEDWSQSRTVQLVRLFFERFSVHQDEARNFNDKKCCAVPVVPQWERRRFGVMTYDIVKPPTPVGSMYASMNSPTMSRRSPLHSQRRSPRPAEFSQRRDSTPEDGSASNLATPTTTSMAPMPLPTLRVTPNDDALQASNRLASPMGARNGTTVATPVPGQDIPFGYIVTCFLNGLLENKYKSGEPEDSEGNTEAILESAPAAVAKRQAQVAGMSQYQRLQMIATTKRTIVDELMRATTAYNLIFSIKRYAPKEPLCQLFLKAMDSSLCGGELISSMDQMQDRLYQRMHAADPAKSGVLTKRVASSCIMSIFGNENTTVWRECLYALELMMKNLEAPKAVGPGRGGVDTGVVEPKSGGKSEARAVSVIAGGDKSAADGGALGLGGPTFYSNHQNASERVHWKRLLHPDGEISIALRQYVVQSYLRFNKLLLLAIESSGTQRQEAEEPATPAPWAAGTAPVPQQQPVVRQAAQQHMVQESITKKGLLVVRVTDLVRLAQRMDEVVDRKKEYLPPLSEASFHEVCQRVTATLPRLNASVHCPPPPLAVVRSTPAASSSRPGVTAAAKNRGRRGGPKKSLTSQNTTQRLAEAKNDKELVEWFELRHYLQITKPGPPPPPPTMTVVTQDVTPDAAGGSTSSRPNSREVNS